MNAAELLRAGRERVARGWTQQNFAVTALGNECDPGSPGATCFCAVGALRAASPGVETYSVAVALLNRAMPATSRIADDPDGEDPITVYNDCVERDDVLALFDRAIAAAEGGGS